MFTGSHQETLQFLDDETYWMAWILLSEVSTLQIRFADYQITQLVIRRSSSGLAWASSCRPRRPRKCSLVNRHIFIVYYESGRKPRKKNCTVRPYLHVFHQTISQCVGLLTDFHDFAGNFTKFEITWNHVGHLRSCSKSTSAVEIGKSEITSTGKRIYRWASTVRTTKLVFAGPADVVSPRRCELVEHQGLVDVHDHLAITNGKRVELPIVDLFFSSEATFLRIFLNILKNCLIYSWLL